MNQKKRAERWTYIAKMLSAALERKDELSSHHWDVDNIIIRFKNIHSGNAPFPLDVRDGRGIERGVSMRADGSVSMRARRMLSQYKWMQR